MKGLLLKDIMAMKKQCKIMFLVIIIYAFYSVMSKNASMVSGMIALFCAMMPITLMAYDEQSKWDRYALSLPLSRNSIVLGKYILGIGLVVLSMLLIIPINIAMIRYSNEMGLKEALLIVYVIFGIAICFVSLMLPIFYKFGIEKGRLLLFVVFFIPVMLAYMFAKSGIKMPSEKTLEMVGYLSPLVLIAMVIVSLMISINIYRKKEF